jgi:hypothetical protein
MTIRFRPGNVFPETPGNVSDHLSGNDQKPETPETQRAETRRNTRMCVSTNIRKRSEITTAKSLKTLNYRFPVSFREGRFLKTFPSNKPKQRCWWKERQTNES